MEGADRVSFLLDDGSGTLQLDMDFESWKSGECLATHLRVEWLKFSFFIPMSSSGFI